jgi:hypothetical protein
VSLNRTYVCAAILFPSLPTLAAAQRPTRGVRFAIAVPAALRPEPLTGRVFVVLSRDPDPEPRLQAGSWRSSVPFFGVDVHQLPAGSPAIIDGHTLGFPVKSLRDLAAGDYYVQALVSVYTQFRRADGHTIWAHNDQWEGQHFNTSPGNLVSEVRHIRLDPRSGTTIRLTLARALPPISLPPDTKWVKHVKIQSKLLTAFWGQPMYLGATVLLPRGYDDEPDRRYPAVYEQGHFTLRPPFGFTTDSSAETAAERAARLARTAREPGFEFFQAWRADGFPRVVAVTFQHPTPYYDDSYAVNSANNGPYGDALLTELIPYLEEHVRLIREPRARLLTGGSTGGWEALALQLYHPDFFGGVWSLYPDPVDLRRYQLGNVYDDTSAFVIGRTEWITSEIPTERESSGQPVVSVRQESQLEAVLGSRGRSGEQFDAWEAAWGPVGADGCPEELWDDVTGTMHHDVAQYMKAHDYDLRDYLERSWPTIGPALVGKIHVYVGDMDNFYLNLAVYHLEDFLEHRTAPYYGGEVVYGRPMKPHGWQPMTNADLIRLMAKHMEQRGARW